MKEKRRFLRFSFEEEIFFKTKEGLFKGLLRDICLGGLYIENPEKFPEILEEIELILNLENTDPPVHIFLQGLVVRKDIKGFGVKLISLPPQSLFHLKNYLYYNLGTPEIVEEELRKFMGLFEVPHQIIKTFNIFHLKQRLLPYLLNRALLYSPKKPFKLSSGKESPYYLDCRKITLYALSFKEIGDLFWEEMRYTDIQGVAGMSIGADPIVCAILSSALKEERVLEGILIRKEPKQYGTGKQLEGNYWKGMKVAVVEDVVTTGGSLLKAISACEKEGLQIVQVLALVDREEGGKELLREKGYELKAFFTLEEIISAYHQRENPLDLS